MHAIALGINGLFYLVALLSFPWARSRVASVVPLTIPEQPSELAATV
jgi:hypothetical protein